MAEKNYSSILSQAISDFNNIQDSLNTVGVVLNSTLIPNSTEPKATNLFANLITNQLVLHNDSALQLTSGTSSGDYYLFNAYAKNANQKDTYHKQISLPKAIKSGQITLTPSETTASMINTDEDYFIPNANIDPEKNKFPIKIQGSVKSSGSVSITSGWINSSLTISAPASANSIEKTLYLKEGSTSISAFNITALNDSIPAEISISNFEQQITGKTRIDIQTTNNESDAKLEKYYIALNSIANGSKTVNIKADVNMTTIEGYQKENTSGETTSKDIVYSVSSSSTKTYIPIKSGNVVASLSGSLTSEPAITTKTNSGLKDAFLTEKPTTGTEEIDYYSFSANRSVSGQINPSITINTPGYVAENSEIGTNGVINTLAGKSSREYYIKKASITANSLSDASINPTVNNTTITLRKTFTNSVSATAGYNPDNKKLSQEVSLSCSEPNLLAGNIRKGVSIFGISGTYLAPSYFGDNETNGGKELRYSAVNSDTEHGSDAHLHSSHMIEGAIAYVDNKPVYGMLKDYSVETTAKNVYNVNGAGLTIPTNNISLSGSTLSAKISATGYVESGKTKISIVIPSQEKETTISSSGTTTINPDSGKLLSKVSISVPAATTANTKDISFSIPENNPTALQNPIKTYTTASSLGSSYVYINANGTIGKTISKAGWVETFSGTATTKTAYLPAALGEPLTYEGNTLTIKGNKYLVGDTTISCAVGNTTGGALTFTNVSNSPVNKGKAKGTTTAPTDGNYVTVEMTRANIAVSKGYQADNTAKIPATTVKAYIAASSESSVSQEASLSVKAKTSVSVGAKTTFNSTTGTKTPGTKTADYTANIKSAAVSRTLEVKDKYMLNDVSISITEKSQNISNVGTATINPDATGANVDDAIESLYKRMLGLEYQAIINEN